MPARIVARFVLSLITGALLLPGPAGNSTAVAHTRGADGFEVSILVYHRFGPTVRDAMTVRTSTFRSQLQYLKEHHYPVVPLRAVVAYLLHASPAPPMPSVVITADDGHRSVFTEMLPVVREYGPPVTLFIYPSAISNASYAMTWAQLDELRASGRFDVQSHTWWHPNFAVEKRRQPPATYRDFASAQLCRSRDLLAQNLKVEPDLVAWPFGIYDDELVAIARRCGYVAGFTLERRRVNADDNVMALPRFLVTDGAVGQSFASMLPAERP